MVRVTEPTPQVTPRRPHKHGGHTSKRSLALQRVEHLVDREPLTSRVNIRCGLLDIASDRHQYDAQSSPVSLTDTDTSETVSGNASSIRCSRRTLITSAVGG